MALKELYHPESGRMRVAGLMSGSGSNLSKIIEQERMLEAEEGRAPYKVVVIFSDNPSSNAEKIGSDYCIPVVVRDLTSFYKERGKLRRDLSVRAEFDVGTVDSLKPFHVDVIAYAGYMSIATEPLINAFLGINVHPADLSIIKNNKRKYTGAHAVRNAILAGEKSIRSTTHVIEEVVDYGRILMVSPPLKVDLGNNFNPKDKGLVNKVTDKNQKKLKEVGDWVIFPKTLLYLSEGRYFQNERGNLYFDNKPIPNGVRL